MDKLFVEPFKGLTLRAVTAERRYTKKEEEIKTTVRSFIVLGLGSFAGLNTASAGPRGEA